MTGFRRIDVSSIGCRSGAGAELAMTIGGVNQTP
jgi:hypothetical protein